MATQNGNPQERVVRSVRFAIGALRLVAASDRPLGVSEIARELGMSASSCFNVLKTLTSERFLVFDSETKKYTLGAGAMELSSKTQEGQRVFVNYRPRLLDLATSLNVVVGFWEIRNERLILLGVVDSEAAIRIQMVPGQRLPLGAGAMGRVIAAEIGLRGKPLREQLESTRWDRDPSWPSYRKDVTQVAKLGWAVDVGQFIGGVTTIASVICAAPKDPRYCIAASGFVGQVTSSDFQTIGAMTHRIAGEIQEGWFAPDAEPLAAT